MAPREQCVARQKYVQSCGFDNPALVAQTLMEE